MKNLEIKTLEYKGVKVVLKIDYENGTASLVEILHANNETQAITKKWIFANRGLEYMNGWLDILMAMRNAVVEAKKELERDLAEKSALKRQSAEKSEQESRSVIRRLKLSGHIHKNQLVVGIIKAKKTP